MSVKCVVRYLCGLVFVAVLGSSLGCSDVVTTLRSVGGRHKEATAVTQEELRQKLDQFEDSFLAYVRRACDEVLEQDGSRRNRRLTLIWQMRMGPMLRNSLDQENPIGAMLDAWTLCIRMRQYLTDGDGRQLFGAGQSIATSAAQQCEAEIEQIAHLVLTAAQLDQTRTRVREVAAGHRFFGEFSGTEVRTAMTGTEDRVLQDVLAIPLTPFRWLGGVDETAQAIKGFTSVAARLTDVVQGLAADARLQAQLLLLETEDLETVQSALGSMERVSQSSERLATSAEKLPAEIRRELTGMLDELDAKQPELRQTLGETRVLVEKLDPAGQRVAEAGDAWAKTAKSIEEMVASFRKPAKLTGGERNDAAEVAPPEPSAMRTPDRQAASSPDEPKPGPATPFDINDYRRTAESLTVTARELQALTLQIRELGGSEELTRRVDELTARVDGIVAQSAAAAHVLTDHAVWRLGQLAVFVFVLAGVFRLVVVRMVKPSRA